MKHFNFATQWRISSPQPGLFAHFPCVGVKQATVEIQTAPLPRFDEGFYAAKPTISAIGSSLPGDGLPLRCTTCIIRRAIRGVW
jgi:hypothetical protein